MSAALFLLIVLAMVLLFTYTNGFHDAANAIATVVATKVLTPRQAVIWAAIFNFIGALGGTAVAKTVGAGLVDTTYVTLVTVLCAMVAGTTWNITTWYFGLPTSSSHSLIGGLIGAALASAKSWHVIKWSVAKTDPKTGHIVMDGLYPKVIIPMISSPMMGFVLGFADGQKTMGVMALATFAATQSGQLEHLPPWLQFLHTPKFEIATWVKWSCGLAMAFGTYIGGWKIIATLARKLVSLKPVNGFAAETTAATILLVTGRLGMPVSTTHCITSSIMGVGCAKRFGAIDWVVVERILWAWVMTIPATGLLAYLCVRLMEALGVR
jgi:PiT family inorganic phosphate transporter